jgi:uncharacterized protein YndB with AHSA1/START domain
MNDVRPPSTPPAPGALSVHVVRATEEIAAPPEEVFEALTDPGALQEWFLTPGGTTHAWELDLTPGGEWQARTLAPDGEEGVLHGAVVTIDAPHTLELTWHTSWDDFAAGTVRYDLEPMWMNGERATRLTVTHVDGTSTPPHAAMLHGRMPRHDWIEPLRRLERYLFAVVAQA